MAEHDGRCPRALAQRCTRSIRPTSWSPSGPWQGEQAARRGALVTRTEGIAHRRHHRRLRTGPVCRRQRARDRRGACRLEGRADRRAGIHHRRRWRNSAPTAAASSPPSARLIRQHSYEVGSEFVERFLDADADNGVFFIPSDRAGHVDVRPRRLHPDAAGKCRRADDRRSSASTPIPTSASTATAARCTGRSRITAATSTRLRWSGNSAKFDRGTFQRWGLVAPSAPILTASGWVACRAERRYMNPSAAEIFPPSSLRAETTRYLSLPIFTRMNSQRSPGCRIQTALDITPARPASPK